MGVAVGMSVGEDGASDGGIVSDGDTGTSVSAAGSASGVGEEQDATRRKTVKDRRMRSAIVLCMGKF